MKIIFDEFSVQNTKLPDGSIRVQIDEAIEGEGPDGTTGPVASGMQFLAMMPREVAINWAIDLAITAGVMEEKDKLVAADVSDMKKQLAVDKARKNKGRRR